MTSLARQREQGAALVADHGRIAAGFFDIGQSRTLAWAPRPQATGMVTALANPERGWDAVVIGEYERAFYSSQYPSMAPLLEHYGVLPGTPEVGGRIDFRAEDHEETIALSSSGTAVCWSTGMPSARLAASRSRRRSAPEHSRCPASSALMAPAQSMAAIGVVPSLMLTPVVMKGRRSSGAASRWR